MYGSFFLCRFTIVSVVIIAAGTWNVNVTSCGQSGVMVSTWTLLSTAGVEQTMSIVAPIISLD